MLLDGVGGDTEAVGDLRRGVAPQDETRDVLLALAEPVGPISREETRAGCAGSTITPHNHDEMSAKTCSGYGTLAG
jgi:hypothetical protein